MAKEWILNSANMRWGLTKKKQVGAVAEAIRQCEPKTLEEWRAYYFENLHPEEDLSNQDCIEFIKNLVIERTFDGYLSEKQTIYEQLEAILGVKIEPAPDAWDRGYNVDFFIKIGEKYIGLQIKPVGHEYIPQIINERAQQKETHKKFTEQYGGKVFYIFSVAKDKKKEIANLEIIAEIQAEIGRLQ